MNGAAVEGELREGRAALALTLLGLDPEVRAARGDLAGDGARDQAQAPSVRLPRRQARA